MPAKTRAERAYFILMFVAVTGLCLAGICFPAMAVLIYLKNTQFAWFYLVGPAGLVGGCIAAIAAIILARVVWTQPLPTTAMSTVKVPRLLWFVVVILIGLRATYLTGLPALAAEVLYGLFPFLILTELWPQLSERLAARDSQAQVEL
jgi:hypothetical protein